jgi:hypothetical protein
MSEYRATPEQWETIAEYAKDLNSGPACLLELRARVEELTLALKKEAACNTDCIFNLSQRLNKLETTQKPHQDKLDRLIALDKEDLLVLRVEEAIRSANKIGGFQARVAIREVATWLEEEFGPQIDWITTELREEAADA